MPTIKAKTTDKKSKISQGLNGNTAVGRCGAFNEGAHAEIANTTIGLNTCVANGLSLYTFGKQTNLIGAPATGWDLSIKTIDQSWTGMALSCQLPNTNKIRIDYRTTLPGALYSVDNNMFGWDWAVSGSPSGITTLPENKVIENKTDILTCSQVFTANTPAGPILFSCSQPIEKLESISWEHWRFHFAKPGVKIMITPLLSKDDIPKDLAAINNWIEITQKPPLYCSEQFEKVNGGIKIISNFYGISGAESKRVPLPPTSIIEKEQNGLQKLPDHDILLQTVYGPYAVTENSKGSCIRTIDTNWINTKTVATKEISISDKTLPFELAYAGDASWDETSTMDRLLSWRVWGQVYSLLNDELKDELKNRVAIPSKEEFENSLMRRFEPVSSQKWLMDQTIFAAKNENSKASFDVDWYNGLTLSGLARAAECEDPEIEKAAKNLASSIKTTRAEMVAYYSIFNDWALGAAWTDARGELFNFDCAHNGLEGILAERKFRLWENDIEGANYMEYLAAKMAPIFIASEFSFGAKNNDEQVYGPSHLYEWRLGHDTTNKSKGPYNLAGDFPEFSALLKKHGPLNQLKQQAADYLQEKIRYDDWLSYYIGKEKAEFIRSGKHLIDKFGIEGKQEAREQASVFYLVSPIISLRLLILEESPEAIINSFKTELPLLTKIQCLAGLKLVANQ